MSVESPPSVLLRLFLKSEQKIRVHAKSLGALQFCLCRRAVGHGMAQ